MNIETTIDPFFRRLIITVSVVIFLYLLYLMLPVILPFVCAFILAYLFNPLVKKLSRFTRRWIAILIVYTAITLMMVLLLWWLIPNIWLQMQAAWEYLPQVRDWYNDIARSWVAMHSNDRIILAPLEANELSETLVDYLQTNYNVNDAQSFMQKVMSSGMTFVNNAGLVVLIPILTFYFLFNWDQRLQTWKIAIPAPYAKKTLEIVADCNSALMEFIKGQLLVMILLGAIYSALLELIGLDLGLIIGMSAGVASFVPYLGFGLGFIAAIIAGVFQFGIDWLYLGLIVGAFLVGQAIEGYVLQPLLLGDKIGLSPLWVIFSVLAGAAVLGFVGMLIALPVSAIINVLFRHAYSAYLDSEFYKGNRQLNLFDNTIE